MSKKNKEYFTDEIQDIFNEYNELLINNSKELKNRDIYTKLKERSDKAIKKLNSIRKLSFILMVFVLLLYFSGLFVGYKLYNAYDEIYKLKLNQSETTFDSINKVIVGLKYKVNEEIKETNTISYYKREDGSIITYNDLNKERDSIKLKYDSLFKKTVDLENKFHIIESENKFIKQYYPIKYTRKEFTKNNKAWVSQSVESPKIDSALYFYNKYKNRIKELENKLN